MLNIIYNCKPWQNPTFRS